MKTIRYAFALILALAFSTVAQTNLPPVDNFALVTNLWFNGHKSNVLAIAEQRLAVNSNDLAGLVLKMEYDFEFINASCISNDMSAVISTIQLINMTNRNTFLHREEIVNDLTAFLRILREYKPTPAEFEEDRAKALIIHKKMNFEGYLKWLHDDGLF